MIKEISSGILDTIREHISNNMLLKVERNFNGTADIITGFPFRISEELLLMSVVNDFHNEGYTVVRLKDIFDAYSNESDAFYEKICKIENIGVNDALWLKDTSTISSLLEQLQRYEGLIAIQCEKQFKKRTFYLGRIVTFDDANPVLQTVGMDGVWDDELDKIPLDEITQITFDDNYSKMFFKYIEAK